MKKPDKTKSSSPFETAPDTPPLEPRKDPAEPGIIAQTDIAPGEPATSAAAGAEIRPVESTLLGDGTDQRPPAARKTEVKAEDAPSDTPAEPVIRDAAPVSSSVPVSTAAPAQKVTVQKTGFWPVFLGGVVAAGLGSAATIWALPHLPAGWLPEQPDTQAVAPAAPDIDVAAIRSEAVAAAQAATSEQIDALRAEMAQAPAAADAPAGPTVEDLAALREQVEAQAGLREQIEAQAAQIQELAGRPQIDPEIAARVQTLAEQADTLEQQLQTAAQAAQAQINAAQAEAQQLQETAAETTRRAEAVAAVAALQTALDRGVTPDEARQTLEGVGLEAPEALTREVPSLDSLQASFPEAARAALRASLRQDSATGNGSLFGNFIRAQTGARSVEPREGTDPDAILSRADAAVEEGRIADAVTEIEALPEPGKTATAMAEWLAGATAYRDAQAALSDLSAPSN